MPDASPADAAASQTPAEGEGQTPAGGAEQTTGQEPAAGSTYPESYVKQLRKESSGYRSRMSELETQLQEIADRDKTETEKTIEKLVAAERRAAEAEAKSLRYDVAAEHGLDMRAAGLLHGSTREEIELRAEELGKLLAERGSKPSAGFDGGARTIVPETREPTEAHNDLLLRSLGMGRRER